MILQICKPNLKKKENVRNARS